AARRAGRALRVRDDFAARPLDELLRPLATARGATASLELPGRPTRLAVSARLAFAPWRPAAAADVRFRGASAPWRPVAARDVGYVDQPSLVVYLQDRDGLVFQDRVPLPAGRAARLEVALAGGLPAGPA